ncbi:MAG: hypothetical protein JWM87_3581 [Candidatus Eremiobacteraeota bacterium]|nr:hypothetical protein [Candidatus Eremiobacteraeota bacterium]
MFIKSFAAALFVTATLATSGPATTAASSIEQIGDRKPLGAGTAYTWVRRDAKGAVSSFGLSLDEKALTNLSGEMQEIALALPAIDGAPFRTAVIDWNPHGHPPEHVYTVPHFDFHFYTIDEASRMAIAPKGEAAEAKPAAELLPEGYITDGETIPMMGKHYLSPANPEFRGGKFTATPIYGYYGGHLIFVESMVTLDYLNSKPALSQPLAQPARFEQPGTYPSQYSVAYDAAKHRYDIVFGALAAHK